MATNQHLILSAGLINRIFELNDRIYRHAGAYANKAALLGIVKKYAADTLSLFKTYLAKTHPFLQLDGRQNMRFEANAIAELREALRKLNEEINKDFAKIFNTYYKNTLELTVKLSETKIKQQAFHAGINRHYNTLVGRIRTIHNSALNALANLQRLLKIEEETKGDTYLLYAGTSPERPFCCAYLNKIAKYSFWNSLDNGHGLPVLASLGGYNCKHHWEVVEKNELKQYRLRGYSVIRKPRFVEWL